MVDKLCKVNKLTKFWLTIFLTMQMFFMIQHQKQVEFGYLGNLDIFGYLDRWSLSCPR